MKTNYFTPQTDLTDCRSSQWLTKTGQLLSWLKIFFVASEKGGWWKL